MRVIDIIHADFANYKKAAMFIQMPFCDGKCFIEKGLPKETCQNYKIMENPRIINKNDDEIIQQYLTNNLTSAIVFGGLEPMITFDEMLNFIQVLRIDYDNHDDIVIYTGYYEREIQNKVECLKKFDNIIIKFGRMEVSLPSRFDEVLGVTLQSNNQLAVKIS